MKIARPIILNDQISSAPVSKSSEWNSSTARSAGDIVQEVGFEYVALTGIKAGAENQVSPSLEHFAYLAPLERVNHQVDWGETRQWERVGAVNEDKLFDERPGDLSESDEIGNLYAQAVFEGEADTIAILEMVDVDTAEIGVLDGGGQYHLDWSVPYDGGKAIIRYQVRRRIQGSGAAGWSDWEDATSTTGHTFSGLDIRRNWQFQVRAVNNDGPATASNTVTLAAGAAVSVVAPEVPGEITAANITATVSGRTNVAISWTAPAANGARILEYEYRVYLTSAGMNSVASVSTGTTRSAALTNQAVGDYSLVIRARNSQGWGPWTSTPVTFSIATAPPAATQPLKPTGFSATAGTQQVVLAWTNGGDGGSAITKWQYYREGGGDSGTWRDIPGSGATTATYTVTGLRAVQYMFRVRAVNGVGNGVQSDVESVTPTADTPTAPQSVMLTPGMNQLAVSWTAPTSDGGGTVTKYQYRIATTAGGIGSASWVDIAASDANTTSTTITSLQTNTQYWVQVRAVNGAGNGAASATVNATTSSTKTVPLKPTAFTATAGNGQLALAWTAGGNGGDPITKYQYRIDPAANADRPFPVWDEFMIADGAFTLNSSVDIAAYRAFCVSANAVTFTLPDPLTSEWDPPVDDDRYVIRQRYLLRTKTRWTAIELDTDDTVRGSQVMYLFPSDSEGNVDPSATSMITGGSVRIGFDTGSGTAVSANIADAQWNSITTHDGYYYVMAEVYFAEFLGAQYFKYDFAPTVSGSKQSAEYLKADATWASGWGGWTDIPGSGAGTTSHTLTGLTNSIEHSVQVRAVSAQGNGIPSDVMADTPAAPVAAARPGKPQNVAAAAGDGQVVLTWDLLTATPAITKWQVKVGNAAWKDITGSGATTVTHTETGLSNSTQYSFRVRAVNGQGNGMQSDTVTATPMAANNAPLKPESFRIWRDGGAGQNIATSVNLDARVANASPVPTKWQWRAAQSQAGVASASWLDLPSSAGRTLDEGGLGAASVLLANTKYWVQVRAVRNTDNGPPSDIRTHTVGTDTSAPDTPTTSNVTATDTTITFDMTTADENNGTITRWQVQHGEGFGAYSNAGWADIPNSEGKTSLSHTITGLTPATGQFVRVRCANDEDNSSSSIRFTVTTAAASAGEPGDPPGDAVLIDAIPGDGQADLSAYATGDGINTWEYRWKVVGHTYGGWNNLAESGNTFNYIVTGLANDQEYAFQVRAGNPNGFGGPSNEVTVLIGAASPPLFTGVGSWADPYIPTDVGLLGSVVDLVQYMRAATETIWGEDNFAFVMEAQADLPGEYEVQTLVGDNDQDLDVYLEFSNANGRFSGAAGDEDASIIGTRLTETVKYLQTSDAVNRRIRIGIRVPDGWEEGNPAGLERIDFAYYRPAPSPQFANEDWQASEDVYTLGDEIGQAAPARITDLTVSASHVEIYSETHNVSNMRNLIIELDQIAPAGTLIVTRFARSGGVLGVGQIVAGLGVNVGDGLANDAYFEGFDFSSVATDIYGNVTRQRRASTRNTQMDILMRRGDVSQFNNIMQDLRGAGLTLFVEDTEDEKWAFGYVRQYKVYFNDGVTARARVTVQGVV